MERRIVILEFCIAVILSITALCLMTVILRRKSLLKIWKQSPGLSLFLGSITLLVAFNGILSIEWIFFAFGLIENVPENTVLLIFTSHVAVLTSLLHNCTTIALFAHRIHCLLYPAKYAKKFNYIVIGVLGLFWVAGAITMTCVLIYSVIGNPNPVPEGCYSFNCTSAYTGAVRIVCTDVLIISVTCVLTLLGSYMIYLYHKYRKREYSVQERKTNTFTLYVFYVRFLCTTVPFFCEFMLSTIANIGLGKIIGPYGAVGALIDNLLKIFAYYLVTRPQKKVVSIASLNKLS
uniref:G_PROTEIN_RECEP_F1_2 domain-containing protein n=1 Tax=Steinernema glaseri TaxID=37863 RepID=A0A1I7Y5K7_9BILA